ncbi:MAG: DEAD/DEAH box helicase, partial [Candidatus Heimdallarchaeaceae archaeon]
MQISDLPINEKFKGLLIQSGITTLYPPQAEAIKKGLLDGNNMVIAIPTASGKTLLAMLACLQTLEIEGKKTLYLSPLRALAYEKYLEFKRFFGPLGYRIVLLTGDYDTEDTRANSADIIIATNEKIDSAIRHQARWTRKLGLIVSDEVHLINDSTRGPTLEVVLAQLKRITQAQIVALSATIKNADEIARWLQARLVVSEWRPVELKEGVLLGQIIKYKDGTTTSLPLHSKKPFDNLVTYILNNKQ